jgi:hypothetical protein
VKADLDHIAAPEEFAFVGFLTAERADRNQAAGDWTSTARWLRETVHYAPRVVRFRSNYARALEKTGATAEAFRQSREALALDDTFAPARRILLRVSVRLADAQIARGDAVAARVTLLSARRYATGQDLRRIEARLSSLAPHNP